MIQRYVEIDNPGYGQDKLKPSSSEVPEVQKHCVSHGDATDQLARHDQDQQASRPQA